MKKRCLWVFLVLAALAGQSFSMDSPSVAVLNSQLTRKFMPNPAFYAWEMEGALRTLKDLQVSFKVLQDEDLKPEELRPFKILILPGTKDMSPQHARAIEEFARRGGKILATGFASYRDDQDQSATLHNNFQLSDLFGVDYLRYNPIPPHAGFIELQEELGEQRIGLGRNVFIQIHPHSGTQVLGVWLDDDRQTSSAPQTLDAAVVENEAKTCIYVGENLFAPENSTNLDVKNLIADLLNRLEPAAASTPQGGPVSLPRLPEFGPLEAGGGSKPEISVGLPFSPRDGFVTSEAPFSVFEGSGRGILTARKNWMLAFHAVPQGFRVASRTASRFQFVPRDRRFPLKIVMWRPGADAGSPFKFASFRGTLVLTQTEGKRILVNRLPLEDYLPGVVSHEVPFYFHPAALESMAVVARTFALKEIKAKKFNGYDICATVSCQAYEGTAYESPASRRAVAKTSGKVLTYQGRLADLPYHATCGGILEDVERVWNLSPTPYLRSVVDGEEPIREDLSTNDGVEHFLLHPPDSFCKFSSRYRWKETYSRAELEELFKVSLPILLKRPVTFNHVLDVQVEDRTPHGRVTSLKITTDQESLSVGKDQIRWLFSGGQVGLGGLQSTLFVAQRKKDPSGALESVTFLGGGWGHGIGLCQWGSEGMARRGYAWPQILSHYFRGTEIRSRL